MPPFLEFPLQRTPLRSTTFTGIGSCCWAEALGKPSADLEELGAERCAVWPVLSSPAANAAGVSVTYIPSPSLSSWLLCFA